MELPDRRASSLMHEWSCVDRGTTESPSKGDPKMHHHPTRAIYVIELSEGKGRGVVAPGACDREGGWRPTGPSSRHDLRLSSASSVWHQDEASARTHTLLRPLTAASHFFLMSGRYSPGFIAATWCATKDNVFGINWNKRKRGTALFSFKKMYQNGKPRRSSPHHPKPGSL